MTKTFLPGVPPVVLFATEGRWLTRSVDASLATHATTVSDTFELNLLADSAPSNRVVRRDVTV